MQKNSFRQKVDRETLSGNNRLFQRKNHVNNHLVQNLQQECILEGHSGCVNCLDWNNSGSLLASGSDDTNVMIWNASQHKKLQELPTQHHGNIFSVKFMPSTGDHVIATGAADGHIFLHDLVGKETTGAYSVEGRIKRLAVSKAEPNIIISASEDGTVREYDIRERSPSGGRVLVNLASKHGNSSECKCVDINPTNSHCIAVGANDNYVRMYDRRMFDTYKHTTYFTPGHLHTSKMSENKKKHSKNICITFLIFNPRGDEILVNMGGEQIYIFNIFERVKPLLLEANIKSESNGVKAHTSNGHHLKRPRSCSETCSDLEQSKGSTSTIEGVKKDASHHLLDNFKLKGNALFGEEKYDAAVRMYNQALLISPKSLIYSNRAAALIKRDWDGDIYAALKDCYLALHINPSNVKAHYRLARCMFELEWFEEARCCMKEFKLNHPEHSDSNSCVTLEKDITLAQKRKAASKKSHNNMPHDEITQTCFDYNYRYCGHCNMTTDIKEANFFGDNGQYIVAGSDEGSFFIWEHDTTNLIRIMKGDSKIVNCVQPHPSLCMLATSGIDSVVKIWSPSFTDHEQDHVINDMDFVASENQKRMNSDPLESMLLSMGVHIQGSQSPDVMPCRTT